MLYYIAKRIKVADMSFAYELVKRFDGRREAENYLEGLADRWAKEGFNVRRHDVDDIICGVTVLNNEFILQHDCIIFETPLFMSGGCEGL